MLYGKPSGYSTTCPGPRGACYSLCWSHFMQIGSLQDIIMVSSRGLSHCPPPQRRSSSHRASHKVPGTRSPVQS